MGKNQRMKYLAVYVEILEWESRFTLALNAAKILTESKNASNKSCS